MKGGTEEEAVEEVGQEGEETKLPGVPSPSPAPHSRLLTVYDTVTRDTAPHYTGMHRTRIRDTGHRDTESARSAVSQYTLLHLSQCTTLHIRVDRRKNRK